MEMIGSGDTSTPRHSICILGKKSIGYSIGMITTFILLSLLATIYHKNINFCLFEMATSPA